MQRPPLFHGGAPGLSDRDLLIPASQLIDRLPTGYAFEKGGLYEHADPEFLYVTSDRDVARAYAARWMRGNGTTTGGTLYAVQVKGPLEADPDYRNDPGICFRAKVAYITAVEEVDVPATTENLLPGYRLVWWGDDTARVLNPEGYAVPSGSGRAVGITEADLKPLGKCPNPQHVSTTVDQLVLDRVSDPAKAEALLHWAHHNAPEKVEAVEIAIKMANRQWGQ